MIVTTPLQDKTVFAHNIIQHVFNLSKKQVECFMNILEMEEKGTCILNLVGILESERSIVQKNLKSLMEKGLVVRKSVTLTEFKEMCVSNNNLNFKPKTNKGYLYIYQPISSIRLKQMISSSLKEWDDIISEYLSI